MQEAHPGLAVLQDPHGKARLWRREKERARLCKKEKARAQPGLAVPQNPLIRLEGHSGWWILYWTGPPKALCGSKIRALPDVVWRPFIWVKRSWPFPPSILCY